MIPSLIFFVLCWSTAWFALSVFWQRNDIADTAWGLFPIALGLMIWQQTLEVSAVFIMVFSCTILWGLRLAFHIGRRTLQKSKEDPRYAVWRETWKWFYVRSFFQVFLLQSVLASLIALPLVLSVSHKGNVPLMIVGLIIFCIGFVCEIVADHQLHVFVQKKKNRETQEKILKEGLWKYSRHPNYFGEVLLWWGVFFMSFSPEYWMYTIVSPVVITLLICFVSGVPMAEKRYVGNAEWEAYKLKTSSLIPWIPKA